MDLAGCYPDSAEVTEWTRSVKASSKGVEVTENYTLREHRGTTALTLMTVTRPDILCDGTIALNGGRRIAYDPKQLSVSIEDISPMLDAHLKGVWGEKMYRIVMTVKGNKTKGSIR